MAEEDKTKKQPLISKTTAGDSAGSSSPLSSPRHVNKRPKLKPITDKNGFKVKPRYQNELEQVEYATHDKLRKVEPYFYTYKTYCKQRWQEQNILDVFTAEFRDKPGAYYKWAIESGQVMVNDDIARLDTVLHDGDLISHKTHKHEPPVLAKCPEIVYQNNNFVVINKPSGIPVHPTGRYKYNTVVNLLKYEQGIACHPCNRLDRLTSGLMFLAKTSVGSKIMFEQLTKRNVEKFYIARVKGDFPLGTAEDKYSVAVDQPLETIAPQLGLNRVSLPGSENGKEAVTVFKKISYDRKTDTSIVKCQPLTGRTHQIRVHLQYLGHPIANDPIYANVEVWGDGLGARNNADYAEIIEKLNKIGKKDPSSSWFYQAHEEYRGQSQGEILTGEKCAVCQSELYTDPNPNDLEIWLHAYKYQTRNYDDGFVEETDKKQESGEQNKGIFQDRTKEQSKDGETLKQPTKAPKKKKGKNDKVSEADLKIEKVVLEYSHIDDNFQRWSFKTLLPEWALESHRPFMELAMEQAAQCPPTTTAFSVGAVLMDSSTNQVLSVGYSRERPGNTHAEQNALAKYYEQHDNKPLPEGTVIYTTMEPCSLRLSGNLPCVDRILEAEGRIITCFVGVLEPKTFVQNNVGCDKLLRQGIEYVHVSGYEKEILELAFKGHDKKEGV